MNFIPAIFLLIFTFSAFGQIAGHSKAQLSDSSRISLLTASPGEELYAAFGHTGIRVKDYKNNFDLVFNYGTFNFSQPGFYTNFVKGKMRYMVSAWDFGDFISDYIYAKRSVKEQVLNLTARDKQKIYAFLNHNALPQNREYYYDFFWDNCATRPREVFEKVLGKRLQYHTDSAAFEKNKTLHDMLCIYVHDRPWVDYAFDLVLGLPCEIIASPRDQTFLPDYLAKYIGCATVDGEPFVLTQKSILSFPITKIETGFLPIHLGIILVLIALIVSAIERTRGTHLYIFDFALFFAMGFMGTFFLSLWLFTSHYSVPENLNLLWLLPSHVVVAFFLLKKKKPLWLQFYFAGTCILMLLLIIGWQWLPLYYNIAAMPLLFLVAFRSVLIVVHVRSH